MTAPASQGNHIHKPHNLQQVAARFWSIQSVEDTTNNGPNPQIDCYRLSKADDQKQCQ